MTSRGQAIIPEYADVQGTTFHSAYSLSHHADFQDKGFGLSPPWCTIQNARSSNRADANGEHQDLARQMPCDADGIGP
jgi:hypothetical protein